MDYQKKNQNSDLTSLAYKNNDPFFIDYFEYRRKAIDACAEILIKKIEPAILNLYKLLRYTSNYVDDFEGMVEELEKILKKYHEKDFTFSELRTQIDSFWKTLDENHMKYDILPKVQYDEQEDILNTLDDKTRAALEAWVLLHKK